jgi:hypothetical protein
LSLCLCRYLVYVEKYYFKCPFSIAKCVFSWPKHISYLLGIFFLNMFQTFFEKIFSTNSINKMKKTYWEMVPLTGTLQTQGWGCSIKNFSIMNLYAIKRKRVWRYQRGIRIRKLIYNICSRLYIAEVLLKLALSTNQSINQSVSGVQHLVLSYIFALIVRVMMSLRFPH